MTFQEFQQQRGKKQSTEEDYKEYQQMIQSKGMRKAAATKRLKATAPSLKGAPLTDGSGQQVGVSDGAGNVQKMQSKAQSVLDAYKKNKVATQATMKSEDIDRSAKGLETAAKKDAIDFPDQQTPPGGDGLSFAGNTKGVMAATSMGMQAVNAQNDMQAIMGGAGTGMQVASMLTGAASGPVGMAIGAGTAIMGLLSSNKKKKEVEQAKKEQEKLLREQKEQSRKARELQLLQSHSSERQSAFANLMRSL